MLRVSGAELLGFPYVYGAARLHDGAGNLTHNFSATKFTLIMPEELDIPSMELAVSNIGRKELGGNIISVYPYEAFVLVKRK